MVYLTGKLEIGKGRNPEFLKKPFTTNSEETGLFEKIGRYTDNFGHKMKEVVFGNQ